MVIPGQEGHFIGEAPGCFELNKSVSYCPLYTISDGCEHYVSTDREQYDKSVVTVSKETLLRIN